VSSRSITGHEPPRRQERQTPRTVSTWRSWRLGGSLYDSVVLACGACTMIVRRTFRPHKIIPYIWAELTFTLVVAVSVYSLAADQGRRELVLPFGPFGVLGTALAIFLGFRANQSYARWWEARIIWSGITSQCRILARQIISAADNAHALGKGGGAEAVATFKREMVYRLIAFAHALRIHLRGQEDPDAVRPLIPPAELERLAR